MATQSYEQLISGANKIKYNELPESNTAQLVGEQLLQMINRQKEDVSRLLKLISNIIAGNFIQYLSQDEYDVLLDSGKISNKKIYVVTAGDILIHAYIGKYQFYPCSGGGIISKWILEDGVWKMDGVWLDNAVWNN